MNKLQCISPIDGSVYVERHLASNPEIQAALARAEHAMAYSEDIKTLKALHQQLRDS